MVCRAGTLAVVHHGIWHCGRQNRTDRVRYMFKIRLNPTVRQLRLWRFLTGDDNFDAHYWLTRLENMPENLPEAA